VKIYVAAVVEALRKNRKDRMKLQTCIQIKKNIKMKKKHFICIIQNNNKNRKQIKIKKLKVSKKN
jgi:ABC-type uncharacterized transport system substrate-binding protein